jgi:hypothetical protein
MRLGPKLITGSCPYRQLTYSQRSANIGSIEGPTRGNQAGEHVDRNEQHRRGQNHDRITRSNLDPGG